MRLVFLLLLLSGCGWWPVDTTRTLSVDDVLRSIHSLDGKVVRVQGYLPKCQGYDCALYASAQAYQTENPDFLGLDANAEFDKKASAMAGKFVVVTGKVSDECRTLTGQSKCSDRAPDVLATNIVLKSPSGERPNG